MSIEKFRRKLSGAERRAEIVNYIQAAAGVGQNQYLMVAPNNAVLETVDIVSDTASTGSVAGQHYEFNVHNLTQSYDMLAANVSTVTTDLAADTVYTLTPDQTTIISKGDVIELQVSVAGTPTDFTTAIIVAQSNYRIV